jgi:hypothetical protein
MVRFGILLLALGSQCLECHAEDLAEADLEVARFVISGHRDGRYRLRSGIFRVVGRTFCHRSVPDNDSGEGSVSLEGSVSVFGAFDYEKGLFRFDRKETDWMAGRQNKEVVRGGKYVRTAEFAIEKGLAGRTITIKPLAKKASSPIKPFDVRTLGSVNLGELQSELSFSRVFGQDKGHVTEEKLIEVESESADVCRLTWTLTENRTVKTTIWFDKQQRFSPIRFEERYALREGTSRRITKPPRWGKATFISEVTWKKTSDVFVPEAFSIQEQSGVRREPFEVTSSRGYSLSFTWENVNEPIPDELFTPEGLADPGKAPYIVDVRSKVPIVVEHPAIKDPVILKEVNERRRARTMSKDDTEEPVPSRANTMWGIIALNVVVVVVTFGIAYRFVWRR